jgi:DNA-binding protein Fis
MSLRESAYQSSTSYLSAFDDEDLKDLRLYHLIMEEVQKGLFEAVLTRCAFNQSWSADVLGISRNNFRTRLKELGISVMPHRQRRGNSDPQPKIL